MNLTDMPEKKAGKSVYQHVQCYHCGEDCPDKSIHIDDKFFCCQGCIGVYGLLQQVGLCTYYDLNEYAGNNLRKETRKEKFAFLEDNAIQDSLISFRGEGKAHVTFYIPYIHCSSCLYLLENFPQLHKGVARADIQFLKKELTLVFDEKETDLRSIVEKLTAIGYEPHISLQDLDGKQNKVDRSLIYRLGVAGFCFGNIMLLSLPEYLSDDLRQEAYLGTLFRYLSLILALPVFFYSADVFFKAAWKGIRHRHLNIDAPVALAIIVTFVRSLTEVFIHREAGFFDSMSGIVFFMLIGRVLQNKTYGQLSFDRDYTDYFPIAATVLKDGKEVPTALPQLKTGDVLLIHNNELLPVDGIIMRGKAQIDYSFVTGESTPVTKETGEIVYAGGRQVGGSLEILTSKPVAQSYLTGLWNKSHPEGKEDKNMEKNSFIHLLAQHFTWVVLLIASVASIYWWYADPGKIWPVFTAVLIIACPCALLLTATFTNGYLIRILGRNGLYLRNAFVIETFGKIDHLVFDKTGTLTSPEEISSAYDGTPLNEEEKSLVNSLIQPSMHSLKQPVKNTLGETGIFPVNDFAETPGMGISGTVQDKKIQIGTAAYFQKNNTESDKGTVLYLYINEVEKGYFVLQQGLRKGVREMLGRLSHKIRCSLISGDKPFQYNIFRPLFGEKAVIRFEQKPDDKLNYITGLQKEGAIVAMTGDGLNDAVALKQSDVGICLAEDINNFSPASDAILEGSEMKNLDQFIRLCQKSKIIIRLCFSFSIIYNLIGIFFAVQGVLSPLMCAILMPSSTLSIVLITYTTSNYLAKKQGLRKHTGR